MKRTVSRIGSIACALFFLGGCGGEVDDGGDISDSSASVVATNGITMNGITMNGITMNGITMNGITMNGITMNGVTLQGSQVSGTLNGSQVSGTGFAGATMTATLTNGSTGTIRIYSVAQDTSDPEIWLYKLQGWKSGTGYVNLCVDSVGTWQPAIAASGTWDSTGKHIASSTQFTFACRKIGAVAKCIDLKYKPWKSSTLWNYHQACTRMIRDDLCGNGTSFNTKNGSAIEVWDTLSPPLHIDYSTHDTQYQWLSTVQGWTVNGPNCFARPRSSTEQSATCSAYVGLYTCGTSARSGALTVARNTACGGPGQPGCTNASQCSLNLFWCYSSGCTSSSNCP